jgi:hypothetical protein
VSLGSLSNAQSSGFRWSAEQWRQHGRKVLGPILAVSIHRDEQIIVEDFCQEDSDPAHDRPLMADVEWQLDDPRVIQRSQHSNFRINATGIVDHDELNVKISELGVPVDLGKDVQAEDLERRNVPVAGAHDPEATLGGAFVATAVGCEGRGWLGGHLGYAFPRGRSNKASP